MKSAELAATVESLIADNLTSNSRRALEEHLAEDAQAQRDYVEQMRMHALLSWRNGAGVAEVKVPSPVARRRRLPIAILALAASLLIGVLATAVWRATADASVGRIVASADSAIQPGRRIGKGSLPLFDGELSIEFDSGTLVTFVGPVDGEIIDALSVRVARGRLTAQLQPGGETGFTVHTPSAEVVDLSTEFGVAVEEGGRTDVVVYEGAVNVTTVGSSAKTTLLEQGDAVSVEMTGRTSRLVSVRRDKGNRTWSVRDEAQAGCIASVTDNMTDTGSHRCYQIVRGGLSDDALAYVDRDYRWINVPNELRGADYVMTFNDDKRINNLQLAVDIVRPAQVFVLTDDRSQAPEWLMEQGFVPTGLKLRLQETTPHNPAHPFSVWRRRVTTPIELPLGANAAKGMYAVAAIPEKLRVACLGDSITAGSGYVNELQQWMTATHDVKNFGVSGATLLASGDKPYAKEKAYADAIAYQPDIVTVMLGTNDTKPQNFKAIADFTADYRELLKPFQKQDPPPKIHLCLPVPVYFEGNFGIDQQRLEANVIPAIKATANELRLELIDVHTPLLDRPDLFYKDNVHPLGGSANLAAPIYEALTGNKPPVAIPPAPPKAIRVACLGDSITEGSGYPGALQELLGNRFMVKNYGVSGATLLSQTDKPYAKQAKFAAAERFAPDSVILMLGTNDSKPKNYEHIDHFADELTLLCDQVAAWKSRPSILLALPAPVIGEGNFGIDNARLEEGVIPAIRQVASKKSMPLIDMNAALKPYPQLFKDRVHPTGAHATMAATAVQPLLELFPLPAIKDNLLTNGSIESGLEHWDRRGGKLQLASQPVRKGSGGLKLSGRTAGYHGPSQQVTERLKKHGAGYYQLRGSVRIASDSSDAVLLVILKDSRGMRYVKTPPRSVSAEGWTDFADYVFLGWTGELQEALFCVETNGAEKIDLFCDEFALSPPAP